MTRAYHKATPKLTHRGREEEIEAAEAVHIRHPPNPPDGGRIMEYGLMHTSGPVQYLMEKGRPEPKPTNHRYVTHLNRFNKPPDGTTDAHTARTESMGVFN
jgi:hypothetical protein